MAAATGRPAGIPAAIEILRATRTRRPARSISISVRLVSSSSSASSRISALSSLLEFAALDSGLLAMFRIRNSLGDDDWNVRLVMSGFGLDAELGGEAVDCEAVAVDAEAAQRRESGPGGVGMVPEFLAGVDVADVHFDGRDFHPDKRV